VFLGLFAPKIFGVVAKKQKVRFGTINATKTQRFTKAGVSNGRRIAAEFQ
jgi:hypothetical protein